MTPRDDSGRRRRRIAGLSIALVIAGCGAPSGKSNVSDGPASKASSVKPSPTCHAKKGAGYMSTNATRTIVLGDATLYIPDTWLDRYFLDQVEASPSSYEPAWGELLRGKFDPDILSDECRGVVHRYKVGERASRYGGIGLTVHALPEGVLRSDKTLPRLKQLLLKARVEPLPLSEKSRYDVITTGEWTKVGNAPVFKMPDSAHAFGLCTAVPGTPPSVWVISRFVTRTINVGFVIGARVSEPSREWTPYCEALLPTFEWLKTPPAERR